MCALRQLFLCLFKPNCYEIFSAAQFTIYRASGKYFINNFFVSKHFIFINKSKGFWVAIKMFISSIWIRCPLKVCDSGKHNIFNILCYLKLKTFPL